MRRNNGWISVHDEEKPESGEEVLALWYSGGFPAPEDLFADPRDRAYGICVYYYPGDTAEQESDRWSPENPWREEYIVIGTCYSKSYEPLFKYILCIVSSVKNNPLII